MIKPARSGFNFDIERTLMDEGFWGGWCTTELTFSGGNFPS
ncbi:hypothetical protein [Bradyrhizobium sp. 186]|nr:hypothetical protein [Bradyrhizobium sp. 186]